MKLNIFLSILAIILTLTGCGQNTISTPSPVITSTSPIADCLNLDLQLSSDTYKSTDPVDVIVTLSSTCNSLLINKRMALNNGIYGEVTIWITRPSGKSFPVIESGEFGSPDEYDFMILNMAQSLSTHFHWDSWALKSEETGVYKVVATYENNDDPSSDCPWNHITPWKGKIESNEVFFTR